MSKDMVTKHAIDMLSDPEDIKGYAVCVVGTRRSAYLDENAEPTYNEAKAAVTSKAGAINLMNKIYGSTMYKYAMLVPVSKTKYINSYGLPTAQGY